MFFVGKVAPLEVGTPLQFTIDTNFPLYTVREPFLSFNIDSASLYQETVGGRLNFTDPDLISFGAQFCSSSPGGAILRIGGSAADDLVFIEEGDDTVYSQQIRVDSVYWDQLMVYTQATGCKLVWDLCALSLRTEPDNQWDSANAEKLFAHMAAAGQNLYGFQFGNEPGHYYTRHYPDGPDGVQLGADLVVLGGLMEKYFPEEASRPRLFGPDNCGPGKCLL